MARKTIDFSVPETDPKKDRDAGKIYVLTEWPARRAEMWGQRAMIAMARAGATMDPGAPKGMGGLLQVGGIGSMLMYIDSNEVVTLLDELMECVAIRPKADSDFVRKQLVDDDIEEVSTRLLLKQEVFCLHTGFTFAEIKSKLISAGKAAISSIMSTFPGLSEQ